MKYRDILGFSKKQKPKKKVIKEKYKSKKTVLDKVKQELNEWNDTAFRNKPKRWSNSYKNKEGLTEFERLGGKDLKEAGAGYDYHKVSKSIEKTRNLPLVSITTENSQMDVIHTRIYPKSKYC